MVGLIGTHLRKSLAMEVALALGVGAIKLAAAGDRGVRVPENIATSFPEIIATFGAVISGSVTSRLRGAMGLLSARDKEDDQYVGSRADSDTS